MRILFFDWASYGKEDITRVLEQMGYEVERIHLPFITEEMDKIFEDKLKKLLSFGYYHLVFTTNYFPVVSNCCQRRNIKYISWVYDCPLVSLSSQSVFNSCNRIFVFDSHLCEYYKDLGVKNIFYMPLGVNVARMDELMMENEDKEKYSSEVSFVGSLYDKENLLSHCLEYVDDYTKGYIDGVIQAQIQLQGISLWKYVLNGKFLKNLENHIHYKTGKDRFETGKYVLENLILGEKTTAVERVMLMGLAAEKFSVDIYTGSDTSKIPKIHNKGFVKYYEEMPKVFRYSKINLNITLRNIQTGIPLRAIDIMGAGGFLLTNYQEDMLRHFEPGVDFVYYESPEDMIAQIEYYLNHEEERSIIAKNGYEKVKKCCSYEGLLGEMLETALKI